MEMLVLTVGEGNIDVNVNEFVLKPQVSLFWKKLGRKTKLLLQKTSV
jgi:hypothetical protein